MQGRSVTLLLLIFIGLSNYMILLMLLASDPNTERYNSISRRTRAYITSLALAEDELDTSNWSAGDFVIPDAIAVMSNTTVKTDNVSQPRGVQKADHLFVKAVVEETVLSIVDNITKLGNRLKEVSAELVERKVPTPKKSRIKTQVIDMRKTGTKESKQPSVEITKNDTSFPKLYNTKANFNISTRTRIWKSRNKTDGGSVTASMAKTMLTRIQDREWTFNATAANEFRSSLEANCKTSELFLTTKANVKLNEYLSFDAQQRKHLNITQHIYDRFPETMPYRKQSFKKCSLVGSSGVLLDSKCGQSIDKADFVIRYNLATVRKYTKDVGSKTNLVTCNPSILKLKYSKLSRTRRKPFRQYMAHEYGNAAVYLPAFTYYWCASLSFKAQDILNRKTKLSAVFPHPDHMILLRQYWKDHHNISELRLTTGLILLTSAMSMCEEVHLYGYWPFAEDQYGRPLLYHYFDEQAKPLAIGHHDISAEFQSYVDLHNKGIIRLHVGSCATT